MQRGDQGMKRRQVLQAAAGVLAAPSLAAAQGGKVLRFVPQANLSSMDAVAGTQYVVRNAALLVWDTLYGVDANLVPQPQMCEGHEVDAAFKTWTFRLRPGLKFHDGAPVLSRDVIASLKRWMVRDTMGQQIAARLDALEAPDDRSFRFRLNRPFPKLLFAIGKSNAPVALIMPERIAKTDPFQVISEYRRLGPDEVQPGRMGARRESGVREIRRISGAAGSGRVARRRQAHHVRPHRMGGRWMRRPPAAALQNGEVDWWETPLPDLVPLLKRNRNIAVDIADPLGNIGSLRMNHLQPPFNDVRVRRALLMGLSQQDYMQAVVGDNPDLWRPLPSFFTPGTPVYTEEGGDILKGPRNYRRGEEAAGRGRAARREGDAARRHRRADHQGGRRGHAGPADQAGLRRSTTWRPTGARWARGGPRRTRRPRAAGISSTPGTPARTA